MDEDAQFRFALSLYRRLNEAVWLRRVRVGGEWQPQPHKCYDNVDYWIAHHPEHRRVNGFVFFDHRLLLGYLEFAAHCVFENEAGELVDITPHGAERDHPFIRHNGTDAEFHEAVLQVSVILPMDPRP
jgi:hypothetical protein